MHPMLPLHTGKPVPRCDASNMEKGGNCNRKKGFSASTGAWRPPLGGAGGRRAAGCDLFRIHVASWWALTSCGQIAWRSLRMKACDRFEWQRALLSSDECMQHSMKIGVRVITTAAIFSTRK